VTLGQITERSNQLQIEMILHVVSKVSNSLALVSRHKKQT